MFYILIINHSLNLSNYYNIVLENFKIWVYIVGCSTEKSVLEVVTLGRFFFKIPLGVPYNALKLFEISWLIVV